MKCSENRPANICEILIVSIACKRNFRLYEAKFSVVYQVGIIRETVAF